MKIHSIGDYTYSYQQKIWTLYDAMEQPIHSSKSKNEVLHLGIQQQRPQVYEAACWASRQHPEDDGFVWRATELLLNGHVFEVREANQINEVARVRSASFSYAKPFNREAGYDRDGLFSIQQDGFLTCNCTSFHGEYGPRTKQGHKLCKHILAVMLAKATNTPLEQFTKIENELEAMSLDALNAELFG